MIPLAGNGQAVSFVFPPRTDGRFVQNDTREALFPENVGLDKPFCFYEKFSLVCNFSGDSDVSTSELNFAIFIRIF